MRENLIAFVRESLSRAYDASRDGPNRREFVLTAGPVAMSWGYGYAGPDKVWFSSGGPDTVEIMDVERGVDKFLAATELV
jgi:hypothetical protein